MFFIYLDPGSGSFLIQLLIAGVAGVAIAIGAQWSKIKRFFSKKKNESTLENEEDDEE
jgi:hypothetical protein